MGSFTALGMIAIRIFNRREVSFQFKTRGNSVYLFKFKILFYQSRNCLSASVAIANLVTVLWFFLNRQLSMFFTDTMSITYIPMFGH